MASRKLKVSQATISQPRHEVLLVAETVAREKGIEKEEVLEVMELALQKTARQKYGADYDVRVDINRSTGEISMFQCETVVEEVENRFTEISLDHAHDLKPDAQIGDVLKEPLPPIDFGRVAAQTARQVIMQKVRDAERTRQYEELKDKLDDILTGTVKRVEYNNVIVDLGKGEGIIRKENLIPRENLRVGDRVRVFLSELKIEGRGPIGTLSRAHPGLMARLFEQEVPEIFEGIIEIKSVARDAGSRAKMAVHTDEPGLDPIGACVGLRGSRVQAIVNEFGGEKVDIIPWSENIATFVVNALQPAEVMKVVIDEEAHRVDVVVDESQLSLAIGRRGQNVRLASQLTGWNIDIITEADDAARRAEDQTKKIQLFIDSLNVDEMIAQLLVSEGFARVEEVAYIELDELMSIESFDEDVANELQNRARVYLDQRAADVAKKATDMNIETALTDLFGAEDNVLTYDMLDAVINSGIKTLDDFADLSGDELLDLIGRDIVSIDDANEIIMKARAHWFNEDNA